MADRDGALEAQINVAAGRPGAALIGTREAQAIAVAIEPHVERLIVGIAKDYGGRAAVLRKAVFKVREVDVPVFLSGVVGSASNCSQNREARGRAKRFQSRAFGLFGTYCEIATAGLPKKAASRAAATVPEVNRSEPKLPPRLMPAKTQSMSSNTEVSPTRTQSAGVPERLNSPGAV